MDKIRKLLELKKLFDEGILTIEEFDKAKNDLIGSENDKYVTSKIEKDEKIHPKVTEETSYQKNYAQKLNAVKTSPSYLGYFFRGLIFLGFLAVTSYNFYFREKWANESTVNGVSHTLTFQYLTEPIDDLESNSVTGISNEKELYLYLDKVAAFWSSEWQKAQKFQNENRRFEEMLMVSRCIDAYPLGIYQGIILLNDLHQELGTKGRDYFKSRIKELGYNANWISEKQ